MKANLLKQSLKTSLLATLAVVASGTLTACNRMNALNVTQPSVAAQTRAPQRAASQAASYVPGQVVVQFRSRPTTAVLQQFAAQNALQPVRVSPMGSVLFRQLNTRATTQTVMENIKRSPIVEYTHPNTRYRRFFTVNDPRSAEQSGLAIIGAAKAWDLTMGDPRVIIAVIDSGADLQHPDLQANLTTGYNVLNQGQPPQDDNGHGTHASGIAAAVGDNRTGVTGSCPRCKLMPIKALDAEGSGTGFDVGVAVVWAVDNGATVINMSLGGETSDPTLERAVKYALSRNVSVVVAAGNNATDVPMYPAALPGVISVGSVTVSRERSDFSNYGNWVSVMAPGSGILSTMPTTPVFMTTNEGKLNDYDLMDGTSMAAPMVAGVVGLIKSRHPNLSPAQIKARLEGTAIDLGAPGFDAQFGNGMIDAFKAVL
jgi:thermitase